MSDDRSWLRLFLAALTRLAPAAQASTAAGTATPAQPAIRIAPTLSRDAVLAAHLTPTLLQSLGARDPDLWAASIARACGARGIDTPLRIAAFLANILVESGQFRSLVESLDYKPQALLRQWPARFTPDAAQRLGRTAAHPADQRGIAEIAYGGRMGNGPSGSGDGWTFRGRGLIQLTGRESYTKLANAIGMPLSALPAHLETRDGAADSAAFYWATRHCNPPADRRDIVACRRIVNGGEIGLPEVRRFYATACAALAIG
ncbi:MAG: glycoside hydrolase family 19 protein [Gemmatimonadaceae bacterium]|nr:glycoside hydrolase family 19 protein [Acetobacteraceae bacterium]